MENQAVDTVKVLYKEMKKTKAESVHFTMHQILNDENASGVISVYDKKKPAHMVIEELREWAGKTKDHTLLNKITTLENDISFLNVEGGEPE